MNSYEAIELFANMAIVFFSLSFASFLILFIHKRFLAQRSSKAYYYQWYLLCFKGIVKYHKWYGIVAFFSMLVHGMLVYFNLQFLPPSGMAAGIGLALTVTFGVIRAFVIKRPTLQKVHLVLALLTCIAVSIHYIQFE